MKRALIPLCGILLVLLGAWCIWPRAKPLPASSPVAEVSEGAPRLSVPEAVESERVEAASAPLPPAPAQLVVLCVARGDERPLAGVRVRAQYAEDRGGSRIGQGRSSSGAPGEELLSARDGRVTFTVDAGRALRVNADDIAHFVSQEGLERVEPLAAGETRELKLVHDAGEGAHLAGLVVARADGAPVAGAEILVNEDARTKSDSGGRFELDFSLHVPPWVRVRAKGFGDAVFTPEAGHETPGTARRVELERSAALEIALTMPPGEAAARVVLSGEGHELSQDAPFTSTFHALPRLKWEADADALWVCRFAELPAGVRLAGEVLGSTGVLFHTGEPIVLAPGETKQLAWDLRGCELVGHVYEPDGKPAAGIGLSLLRQTSGLASYIDRYAQKERVSRARSGADGSFRFASVSPGSWLLAPDPTASGSTPLEEAIAPAPQRVTIREGETSVTADVQLARGIYILGQLLAPGGESGAVGYVSALAEDKSLASARTDDRGNFRLGPLAPVEFQLIGTPDHGGVSSLPVQVRAPKQNVQLLARPAAEVEGVVVDGASGVGTQAAITIGGEHGSMTMTRTQPDGSFQLDGLEPGIYTLFASTSDGRAGELAGVVLDPAAPAKGRQVVLEPGAKLRVRYEGALTGDLGFLRNGNRIGGDGIEAGHTLTQVVPPGKLAVEFRFPGIDAPEVRELELRAGEERELVFKAPAGK